MITLSL